MRGAEATADPAAFRMHGAREILAFTGGAARILEQVEAIERSVVDSPGFAFDLSKALIETVCKTIHADRGQPVDGTPSLPKLFKATCKLLQLVPDTHLGDKGVQESLKKTLNGMMTAIQGVTEIRNAQGTASHGRDAYAASLAATQAGFVARTADALVSFLYKVHRDYPTNSGTRHPSYEDEADFNDYVDELHDPVRIFDLTYRPSEVLFHVDREAYRDILAGFRDDEEDEEHPP